MLNLMHGKMNNPFEVIEERLSNIENLILSLKNQTQQFTLTERQEQLLTIQEAAIFLNLTVPTIYSKVSKGELPFMKRGKRLHFSSTELMQYIKEGRKKTNSEIQAESETYLSNKNKGLR
jgi:excisionase family DNA binding protein